MLHCHRTNNFLIDKLTFMKSEGSLLCLQEPTNTEPDTFGQHPPSLFS